LAKIVDSQVHLWCDRLPPPLHRQAPRFWSTDLIAEMRAAGVDAAILAPPAFFPEGNDLFRREVARHPSLFAAWGFFPLDDPASRALAPRWREPPFMLGARFFLAPQAMHVWTDGTIDWLWPAAEKAGLPLGVHPLDHVDTLIRAIERHPHLRIVIEHMGADVFARGPLAFRDFEAVLALARFPNVAIKLSGLPAQSLEPYPFPDMHEMIRRAIDMFGPTRCFWGSDLTRQPCSYRETVTMFTEEMPWLDSASLREIMGDALCRWIGWRPAD
jgi:predicted TIM-barrel fold metal-dependent hydrolase